MDALSSMNFTARGIGAAVAAASDNATGPLPPLSYDAAAAEAWYQRLAPTDSGGRTNICYGIYRWAACGKAFTCTAHSPYVRWWLGEVLAVRTLLQKPQCCAKRRGRQARLCTAEHTMTG